MLQPQLVSTSLIVSMVSILAATLFAAWNIRLHKLKSETKKQLGVLEQDIQNLKKINSGFSSAMLNNLISQIPGGLFQCQSDRSGQVHCQYASPGYVSMLEMEPDSRPTHEDLFAKIHNSDNKLVKSAFFDSIMTGKPFHQDFRMVKNDGSVVWTNISAVAEKYDNNSFVWYGFLTDITNRKSIESQYEKMALYDSLTDIPNRRFFFHRLDQTIAAASRKGQFSAVLYMDLDDFKSLNDERGHDIGDELLRLVAERLSSITRKNDTVSRLGGDEFVLLLEELDRKEDIAISKAKIVAEKVLNAFKPEFELSDGPHVCSPSIGVCVFNGTAPTGQEILSRADSAMYLAKKSGQNTYVIHDSRPLDADMAEECTVEEFTHAIKTGQLCLQLQPQLNRKGIVVGSEALVRWNHPTRGTLGPAQFLPLAERCGMMNQLNDWVLKDACRILAQWNKRQETRDLTLAINVSAQKIASSSMIKELDALFKEYKFERNKLTFEITEKALSRRPETMTAKMHELKKTGIRFSLDDFGTGRSSLTQLNLFPVDEIKIDGEFVSKMEDESGYSSLIEGILGMASALHLETVAEHVSSKQNEEFLRSRGCNKFQGYYYYPPVDETEFLTIVAGQKAENKPFKPTLVAS